jgi:hypothetical protein
MAAKQRLILISNAESRFPYPPELIGWITRYFCFSGSPQRMISDVWWVKDRYDLVKWFNSGVLIRLKRGSRQLVDDWSWERSIDHSSRKCALSFRFFSWNKSRCGSVLVSNWKCSARAACHLFGFISLRLKSWDSFMINFTVLFMSAESIRILDKFWGH